MCKTVQKKDDKNPRQITLMSDICFSKDNIIWKTTICKLLCIFSETSISRLLSWMMGESNEGIEKHVLINVKHCIRPEISKIHDP